jgi:hypothetical protein
MMASRDTKLATSAAREGRAVARENPKVEAPATAPSNAERRDVDDGCFLSADDDVDEMTRCGGAIAETRTPRRLITETSFERDVPDVLGARAARAAADIALADIAVRGQVT